MVMVVGALTVILTATHVFVWTPKRD